MSAEAPPGVVFFAGAFSGLAARCLTHPLDTVKARLQVQAACGLRGAPRPYAGALDCLAKVLAQEGVPGLYRGFAAVLAAAPLASAVYFGTYEGVKTRLRDPGSGRQSSGLGATSAYLLAGVVAQAAAGLVYTPMDVVKERLQVARLLQPAGSPPIGSGALAAAIVRRTGLRSLYTGYWASNAAWWPWNCFYFLVYENAREATAELRGCPVAALPPVDCAAAASLAATVATVATHPIDTIKTRLQTLPAAGALGAVGVARAMFRAEGLASFGAGLGARLLYQTPGAGVQFFMFNAMLQAGLSRRAEEAAAQYAA